MKDIVKILMVVIITSCSQEKEILITNNSVGNFALNQKLNVSFDKNIFDITTNSEKRITSITVKSEKYKTSEGFGVGSHFKDIKKISKGESEEIKVSKRNVVIGSYGDVITHNNITFLDINKDKIVDFVLIKEYK